MIGSPIEEIKNRLDIVDVIKGYIKLHKAGANYRSVCPFHSEKSPSFFVSPPRQIWHCFGSCSEGGDMFKFVMKIEGVEFGDALKILAQKAGVELKREDPKLKTARQRLYEISDLSCSFFETQLDQSIAGQEAKKYLLGRGIKEESIKKWRLGYSPDAWQGLTDFLISQGYGKDEIEKAGLALRSGKTGKHYDRFRSRIMFPVFDLSTRVIGFGGKVCQNLKRQDGQNEAKYINTPATILYDKSRTLYGLNKAGIGIRKNKKCILVEGYMDVIMANQAGFENVIATSGTALTSYQLKILKRYSDNLLTAFDMDIAGNSATKRGIDLAQTEGFNIKIVTMPEGKDPADIVYEDLNEWKKLVGKAKSIHDFYFENILSKFNKDSLEGKKEIAKILLAVIKKIPNKIEQTIWLQGLANVLGVREQDVIEELAKIKIEKTEQVSDKEVSLTQKTRKELLQERLAILIIKDSQNADLIKEGDLKLFSLSWVQTIDHLKSNNNEVPDDLKDQLNYLSLKADVESNLDKESIKREFKECFRELKSLVVKEKLDDISKEIKLAEQERNSAKIQELLQRFNQYSKSRNELEIYKA